MHALPLAALIAAALLAGGPAPAGNPGLPPLPPVPGAAAAADPPFGGDPVASALWDAAAAALVLTPGLTYDDLPADVPPGLAAAVERLAHAAQLWQAGDPNWRWGQYGYGRGNIIWTRSALATYADCPRLEDAAAFLPRRGDIVRACDLAASYATELAGRWQTVEAGVLPPLREAEWRAELTAAIEEARTLRYAWECAWTATHDGTPWAARRDALRRLREAAGPEAYYAGRMPPPVPYWRVPYAR